MQEGKEINGSRKCSKKALYENGHRMSNDVNKS